ncbi:MAG: T9SS type A sorting domain-containing protein [Bacteroidota bacterium]
MKKYLLLFVIAIQCFHMNGQSFFSEDFASGIPGSWTNVDNSGNNVLWRATTTGALNQAVPVDPHLSTIGTSASNGYLILDSDSAGLVLTENSDLTTAAINCSGHSIVYLSFNEYFAQFGSSQGIVKVSNDNINWVDVHNAETGLVADSGTANPYPVEIDISATAANQATVYIRFNYIGAYDYWWFVDDVQLLEPSATDLSVNSIVELDTEYTRIPLSQATALNLSAEIKNVGLSSTASGTALLELVDAGSTLTVFSEVVNLQSLSPGNSQTVVPSMAFSPPAAASYYSRVTVTIAGDGNAGNNTMLSDNVMVSDSVYSRDDDAISGVQQIGSGAGEDGIAGQNFMVNTIVDLTSVTVFLQDTFSFSASGTPLFLTVHPQANNATAPDSAMVLAVTDTLMLYPGTIPAGGAFFTLPIQGGSIHLMPGLYFIGFHEDADPIPMGITSSKYSPGAVWVHANSLPDGWARAEDFGFQFAYMIRANFGMVPDGVDELSKNINVTIFPNPSSSGIFYIIFERPERNYSIKVFNAMGQLESKSTFHSVQQGQVNLAFLPDGIYTVQISSNEFFSAQKICVAGK